MESVFVLLLKSDQELDMVHFTVDNNWGKFRTVSFFVRRVGVRCSVSFCKNVSRKSFCIFCFIILISYETISENAEFISDLNI